MKVLDRLVARTFLRLFFLVLAAAPPLFVLGDITDNLDRHLDRGVSGADITLAYLYQIPLFLRRNNAGTPGGFVRYSTGSLPLRN